ncbi:cytochrome P450 [Mycena capillaripes]|nr:cytochrome P450 [Mycena capillaripes]
MDYTLTFAALIGVFCPAYCSQTQELSSHSSRANITFVDICSGSTGHMLELMDSPTYGENESAWQKMYGTVYRVRGCLGQERLMISDPLALQYIIKSANFHHAQRKDAANVALYGAKSVTSLRGGQEHRRLRAALSVAFTANAVSEYQAVLERIARRASDELEADCGKAINVCPLLASAALSAASELTFGVEELDNDLVGDILKIRRATIMAGSIKIRNVNRWYRSTVPHILSRGNTILQEKIAAIESGTVDLGHDLFTKLLANTSSSKKKLTEDEITEQTSVFLVAGHETTATTLAFGLLELGRNPEFQQKLREGLNSRQGDVVYDSLPLLNAFIKEVLRVYPAAALRERVALKDEIIPLSEGIVTTTGQRITQIPIRKGDLVMLAIASYQRLQSLWGDDADSFNPYRWIDGKIHEGEAIGPLSFLGGPHVCPGWRFAVLEMQVILAELIRKFSFTLPANEIVRVKLSNTLQPTDSSGQKCVCLYVASNLEYV